jgi:glycosyltransferase involved in cell wall biosynthesis
VHILWVKVGGLWPLNTGGRLRSFNIVSELARQHQLVLLTTHAPGENPGALANALPQCERVSSFPYAAPKWRSPRLAWMLMRSWFSSMPVDVWKHRVPALQREASRLLASRQFDLCIVDFVFAAPNVDFSSRVPIAFFAHNVEYMILKRLSRTVRMPLLKALLEIEWRKMRRYEAMVNRTAQITIAVSPQDREIFKSDSPEARVVSVATGVDVEFFAPHDVPETPLELVFTGSMDWHPNEDAVLHFIANILPRVRREIPGVTFTIAGRNPSRRVQLAAADNAVNVTGTVDDIRPYVDAAAVCVVPLRVGGGTRLKIFEALSMGKAVVATSIAVEGLPLVDGQHYLNADEPDEFAQSVIALLRDPERRRALGRAGRLLTRERYAWPRIAQQFSTYCDTVRAA